MQSWTLTFSDPDPILVTNIIFFISLYYFILYKNIYKYTFSILPYFYWLVYLKEKKQANGNNNLKKKHECYLYQGLRSHIFKSSVIST